MKCAGIDVSKDFLDLFVPQVGFQRFEYSEKGLEQLVALLDDQRVDLVVVEASGGLELEAVDRLYICDHTVFRLNPRAVRAFAESIGRLEKTDRVDAEVLCLFGPTAQATYPAYEPATAHIRRLKAMWTRRRQLVEMRADEQRRRRRADQGMADSFDAIIGVLSEHIDELEARMQALLKHDELRASADRLRSVPGVGKMTTIVLLAHLPELGKLGPKKIAKLVGVAPMADDSGRRKGHRHTRGGRQQVRNTLYMATLSAIRYNPFIAAFAERLDRKGKHHKVIRIACANKLIRLLNAMERDKLTWQQTQAAAA